jgi:hypothetical protein
MKTCAYFAAGAIVLATCSSSDAYNVKEHHLDYIYHVDAIFTPNVATLAQPAIVTPMCDRDMNPSDPVVFKVADGRCSGD